MCIRDRIYAKRSLPRLARSFSQTNARANKAVRSQAEFKGLLRLDYVGPEPDDDGPPPYAAQLVQAAILRKMKEEGVEIDNVISPDKRMQLFRKNAESRLTDGSGAADIEALSVTLPADLGIEPKKAETELLKIANDKKRSTMVAAVAELRQKKVSDVVKSAKNLVACHGVAPESKLEWGVKEELQDIYSVFANEGAGEEEQKRLQDALGLDDETCDGLREIVKAGKFQLKQDVADEALF